VISATFSLEFRRFKGTMLQFALMLLSANALKCNTWATAAGTTTDGPEADCSALPEVGGVTYDACVSYSFTLNDVVYNAGSCATSATCDQQAAIGGSVPDYKCTTCKTDNCNTKATAGGDAGGDTPAATDKKNWFLKVEGVADTPDHCTQLVMTEDCTKEKLAAIDESMGLYTMGSCPTGYSMECSMSIKEGDETHKYPETKDVTGCGKGTRTLKTKDCAACTSMKDQLGDDQKLESGPTCSSGSALAFGLAALVASLVF